MQSRVWHGRRVFLTGHTGFKGGWMSLLLSSGGARVVGYSLKPVMEPNLFHAAEIRSAMRSSIIGDVLDRETLANELRKSEAEVVIHMAAQPLVRSSYQSPLLTWSTNVMGTVNLLEAVRACPSVRAVLVVTSDKCYDNKEWERGYRESDSLGGHDPYSASKACAELVAGSYRDAFLSDAGVLVATARAGNVIGGGDWSADRLIPDAVRALSASSRLAIRSPHAKRPWQHVLDAISGYVLLLERLLDGDRNFATAFNFGPLDEASRTVIEVLEAIQRYWPGLFWYVEDSAGPVETRALLLDSRRARSALKWEPKWSFEKSVQRTVEWYRSVTLDSKVGRKMSLEQIDEYFG